MVFYGRHLSIGKREILLCPYLNDNNLLTKPGPLHSWVSKGVVYLTNHQNNKEHK